MKVRELDEVIQALTGEDPDARKAAADELATLDDDRAREALVDALNHPATDVQINAAEALGKTGSAAVVAPLVAVLADRERAAPVRQATARALGTIAHPQSAPALVNVLPDGNTNVVRAAVRALGEIGARHEHADLRAYITGSLLPLLVGAEPIVAQVAAEALGRLRSERAVPSLIMALNCEEWPVRQAAAKALGEIGARVAGPQLTVIAESDRSSAVRYAARRALERLSR